MATRARKRGAAYHQSGVRENRPELPPLKTPRGALARSVAATALGA